MEIHTMTRSHLDERHGRCVPDVAVLHAKTILFFLSCLSKFKSFNRPIKIHNCVCHMDTIPFINCLRIFFVVLVVAVASVSPQTIELVGVTSVSCNGFAKHIDDEYGLRTNDAGWNKTCVCAVCVSVQTLRHTLYSVLESSILFAVCVCVCDVRYG